MSVREEFGEGLRADWASVPQLATLDVRVTERALEEVKRPIALVRQKRVSRAPEAPQSHRKVELLLTLISPHINLDSAAEDLDQWVEAALDYLDPRYEHDAAECVAYAQRLAYDIPITILASKE